MKKKALIIPVAALAVMGTNAYAFNSEVLEQAGLSNDQIAAFEAAHELRQEGNRYEAREVLEEAGVDHETLQSIRENMKEQREEHRAAMHEALEDEDYEAFKAVTSEDGPLSDVIDSEADFKLFIEAHELRESGDHEGAKEIMTELGFEPKEKGMRGHGQGPNHAGFGHRQSIED